MAERIIPDGEMRRQNCEHRGSISARVYRFNGEDEEPTFLKTVPNVGQTRNCLNWWQRKVLKIPKFIYPKEDDSCINTKKFKSK